MTNYVDFYSNFGLLEFMLTVQSQGNFELGSEQLRIEEADESK